MIEKNIEGLKEALQKAVFNEQQTKETVKIALNTLLQYALTLNFIRTKEMAVAGVVFAVEQYTNKPKTKLTKTATLLTIKTRMTVKSNLDNIIDTVVKSYPTQTSIEQMKNIVEQACSEWLQEIYTENGM